LDVTVVADDDERDEILDKHFLLQSLVSMPYEPDQWGRMVVSVNMASYLPTIILILLQCTTMVYK
jgi:hypothetical protein